MIKTIILLPRRADRGQEEFRRYLDDKHLPLVRHLPGLQRLVVNYAVPAPDGAAPAYDAVAEDWFESVEAMQAALASPEGQAVYADTQHFTDVDRLAMLIVRESTIVPGEHGAKA
jgi:uncharacterized protein (TIGR02118 family)